MPQTQSPTHGVLGFVGLGHMGGPMSTRLVTAGHVLVGFDAAGTRERLPPGAEPADDVASLAGVAETALLSLPDGHASAAVCQQIATAPARRTRLVIDLSTIGMPAAQECARILGGAGIEYVDAPVSGGVAGAQAGTLAIMVGAPAELFERVRPLLETLGKNVFRLGDQPGHGQAMKLLNNYVAGTALAATSEAVVFGARVGLDFVQMLDVLNVSSGRTWASEGTLPRHVLSGGYDFGFAAALMAKDIRLYLESATAAGVPRDLASASSSLWQAFNTQAPGQDFTAIHKYLQSRAEGD
jgi:3-hydroxyisobutyrate dehydrogenase-like beta-hydroxyacid dehydrogenase